MYTKDDLQPLRFAKIVLNISWTFVIFPDLLHFRSGELLIFHYQSAAFLDNQNY